MSQEPSPDKPRSLDALAAMVMTGEPLSSSERLRVAGAVTRTARAVESTPSHALENAEPGCPHGMQTGGTPKAPCALCEADRLAASVPSTTPRSDPAERVRLILKGYADSYREMDRDPANDGNVMAGSVYADFTNNIIPHVLEALACAPSAIAEKTDDNTRVLELHAALHHSLQNTDEAIEHIEKLAAEVIQWCESAALDADNRTVWDQRIALLRRILEPEPIVATDGGKQT